jgi:putative transcriptional regulator
MSTKAERAKETTLRRQPRGKRPGGSLAGLSPAGAKIVGAFNEAVETIQDEGSLESLFSANTYKVSFALKEYTPDDVRRARSVMRMSQALFAQFLGVNASTVQSWEQGIRPPSVIARRFMTEIESDPQYWLDRIARRATRKGSRRGRAASSPSAAAAPVAGRGR